MIKNHKYSKKAYAFISLITISLLSPTAILISTSNAANPVIRQGSTTSYGVLAASTVTNTGPSSISGSAGGDIGLSPGTSFTGGESVTRSGVVHIADSAALEAKAALVTAYDDLNIPASTVLAASDLAGQTITPGSYAASSGFLGNSGILTFDAQGDTSAIFIMRSASSLSTSPGSSMVLANGAQACNVYWQVGSSATIGVNSTFVGHLYALASITANTGSTIYGQLLARTGAVTLDSTRIINDACTPSTTVITSVEVPVYDDLIPRVSSTLCIATDGYRALLIGNFPETISVVSVNGINLSSSNWDQSAHLVAVTIPAGVPAQFSVAMLINGVLVVPIQNFECGALTPLEAVVPSPTPTPVPSTTPTPEPSPTPTSVTGIDVETPTVDGGTLPNTAGNGYTILLAGLVAITLGLTGLTLRKNIKNN